MNNSFCQALISENKNPALPKEMDWFRMLIGEWDILWTENVGTKNETTKKGEWIFSRVLNGFGVQDLFIDIIHTLENTPDFTQRRMVIRYF